MRKKLLYALVVLLVVLLVSFSWLLGTQSGLNTVVSLAQKAVPGLEISQARGRLISAVEVKGLQYRPDAATGIDIDELALRWQASALLGATLYIESLNVQGVTVHSVAAEPAETESSFTPPDIKLPLQIEVASAAIEDVSLIDEDGAETQLINSLNTVVKAEHKQLKISQFHVDTDDVVAAVKGEVSLSPPYQSAVNYQLTAKQLLPTQVSLDGHLVGNTDELTIEQTLSEPLVSSQFITVSDVLQELKWSLDAKAAHLNLADVLPEQQTRIENLSVTADGSLTSMKADIQSDVSQPDLTQVAIKAGIRSEDLKTWLLELNTAVSDKQNLQVKGSVDIHGDKPVANLKASWQNLSWPLQGENIMIASPEGALSIKGGLDDYQASLTSSLDWQGEQINVAAETSGSTTQLTVDTLAVKAFEGQLDANGQIDWQDSPLQYQLSGQWQGMTLPKQLTQQLVKLRQGRISINGDSTQLSLVTQTDLMIDEQSASIAAQASGHTETGFEQAELTVKLADGDVKYEGPVLWSGTSLLNGKVTLTEFNPGILAAEWPGKLSGDATIKLDNLPAGIQAQISDIAISGDLRQRAVKLTGNASYSDNLIEVDALKLLSGKSSLTASGQLVENKADFNWSVQSPDLLDFYPQLKGSLNAQGQVTGTLKAPAINTDLQASKLQFEDIKAGAIEGKVRVMLSENADLNADIDITDLTLPQIDADSLKLSIKGKQNAHQVDLALVSEALSLTVQAEGNLDGNQQWQGHFIQFDFSNEKAGQWQLSEKGEVLLAAESQNVPKHCWSSSNGQFCFEASHKSDEWQTAGNFQKLPLSLFEGFISELEQLQGTLRGQFDLAADNNGVITGDGKVFLDDASVQLNQSELTQQKPISLNNVALNYQVDASKTLASFHLEPQLDGVSAIDAEIETANINTLTATPEQAVLKGHVTTAIKDLSALELSHPAFTDLKGQIDVDLRLAGTVTQPKINGTASLQQGQVAIVDAGIVLKQIQANIQGDMAQVGFDLTAKSGKGSLDGKGQFKLNDSSWQLTTALKGEQLELMNTPEALVIAEPDLTISVTPEKTLVKGKVHIPEAELEPREFNSTVSPSKDVVVVSDEQDQANGGPVTELDVTVSLGDKVKLQAMGFQGRLTGELRVFGKTSDVLLGNGEIKIKDGSYVAYGQLLHVDDGSIRFAGPVDNPELDLKAVRKGKDYQAGLHIEGFAGSPQASLFSDPDMTQDNILSYILLGKPVEQASATDAALLASAATGMGLQNGAMIGDQIASTFGLDEFSIQGDSAENAAVQVGKYLSPKLYLSYGIGVFDSVNTVELRYQLSKIWALKAESGTESGIDLLYTYERGGPKD